MDHLTCVLVGNMRNSIDNCEMFPTSDGNGQYIQKRAPMQWPVALILYILPTPCALKEGFAIAYRVPHIPYMHTLP